MYAGPQTPTSVKNNLKGKIMAATKAPAKKPAAKAPVKKPAAKAPAKKPATKAPEKKASSAAKVAAISERYTKTQLLNELSEKAALSRKEVSAVLDELSIIIERHINKRAIGEFTLPGLLKIKTVKKPARRARKGINPFTGQETTFQAKPASTAVKVTALKSLKDMANS